MSTERVALKNTEQEEIDARRLALRYRAEFVDLRNAEIDHDLFRTIQVDLMFRYNFVYALSQRHAGNCDCRPSEPAVGRRTECAAWQEAQDQCRDAESDL